MAPVTPSSGAGRLIRSLSPLRPFFRYQGGEVCLAASRRCQPLWRWNCYVSCAMPPQTQASSRAASSVVRRRGCFAYCAGDRDFSRSGSEASKSPPVAGSDSPGQPAHSWAGARISFPPRCYFCRRAVWWPLGMRVFRGSTGWHIAHRSCAAVRVRRKSIRSTTLTVAISGQAGSLSPSGIPGFAT